MRFLTRSFILCVVLLPLELTTAAEEQPEEIVIIGGEMDVFKLEKQVFEAEKNLYAAFSELNEDEDYDVECKRVEPTGTRLSQTLCRPNYINELLVEYGTDPMNIPQGEIVRRKEELQRLMMKFLEENMEFRQVALIHGRLKQRLKEVQAQEVQAKEVQAKETATEK